MTEKRLIVRIQTENEKENFSFERIEMQRKKNEHRSSNCSIMCREKIYQIVRNQLDPIDRRTTNLNIFHDILNFVSRRRKESVSFYSMWKCFELFFFFYLDASMKRFESCDNGSYHCKTKSLRRLSQISSMMSSRCICDSGFFPDRLLFVGSDWHWNRTNFFFEFDSSRFEPSLVRSAIWLNGFLCVFVDAWILLETACNARGRNEFRRKSLRSNEKTIEIKNEMRQMLVDSRGANPANPNFRYNRMKSVGLVSFACRENSSKNSYSPINVKTRTSKAEGNWKANRTRKIAKKRRLRKILIGFRRSSEREEKSLVFLDKKSVLRIESEGFFSFNKKNR